MGEIVLAYTTRVYRVMFGRVKLAEVAAKPDFYWGAAMWYFSWPLGVGLAVGCGILNGVWHEFHSKPEHDRVLPEPTE